MTIKPITTTSKKYSFPENNVGWIENESGEMIAIFPDNVSKEDRHKVKNSAELFSLVEEFVQGAQNGMYKPKSTIKKFKQLLDKTYE